LPEAEAPADMGQFRLRSLVDPGVTVVTLGPDHDVVELYAVRAFEVLGCLRGFLQELGMHGRNREIVVSDSRDNIATLRDQLALQNRFHERLAKLTGELTGR